MQHINNKVFYINNCFITVQNEYHAVILYGDEQFVNRTTKILQQHSNLYGNILPFPGLYKMVSSKVM